MMLLNELKESQGDDQIVYEVDATLNTHDFKHAKNGIIINLDKNKCIGLKSALLKATKAKESDLKVSTNYVLKTYHTTMASGGYLKDHIRPYLNEDQRDVAIINTAPYNKLVNGIAVTFIHPKSFDEKNLSKMFMEQGSFQGRGYVEFFIDKDVDGHVDVESFSEYKILDKKFTNVTDESMKARGTYKFVVDRDVDNEYWEKSNGVVKKRWREHLYIVIVSSGYVRMGGTGPDMFGRDVLRVLHKPTGDTDLERKKNAWKAAVAEAKKRRWM